MVYKINLSDYASDEPVKRKDERETFEDLVEGIISEMEVLGFRERTIFDYRYHSQKFMEVNGIKYIDEITRSSIIKYLDHGNVSPATRRIRLKCIRAILNKLHDRGKIKDKFWLNLQVRVVEKVKVGVTASELNVISSRYICNSQWRLVNFKQIS